MFCESCTGWLNLHANVEEEKV